MTSNRVGGGRDTLNLNRKNGNDSSTTPSRINTKNRNGNKQQRFKHDNTNNSVSFAKPKIFPNKLSDDVGGGNAPVLSNSNRNYNHKKKQSKNDILRQNDERKKRNKKKRDNKNIRVCTVIYSYCFNSMDTLIAFTQIAKYNIV